MTDKEIGKENLEQQLDDILDLYCRENKVAQPINPPNILQYLNMSRDFIEALSREDRYSISIELSQYAMYIQRLLNRERARVNWTTGIINKMCSKHWNEYDKYTKAEMKIYMISAENSAVLTAIKVKNHAQIRVDELSEIANYVKHIADILSRSAYGLE